MKNRKKNKGKNTIFYKILSTLLIISSVTFLGFIFYMDLLPKKFLIMLTLGVIVFNVFNVFLVNLKRLKVKIKKVLSVFMILGITIMTIASFYVGKTMGVLINNGDSKYKVETYYVMTLKQSKIEKLKHIKNKEIGYFKNSTGSEVANSKLKESVEVKFKPYKASNELINNLLDSKIDVIVIEKTIKDIMEEEYQDLSSKTKIIYTFTVETQVETTLKEVDVTEESFAVYISGIDTFGQISSVSRSDVNMVMVVNPSIRQILWVSIPRDYYVQLHGTTGNKDKLTHAGIYGIDMSVQTIEDLLDLDINYYIKVNFTSVIDIVNALGGLNVYSEYTFTSYSGYKFKKGMNSVNGEQALDFARTRKAFKEGDRQRGKNQQAVIEAIVRKATDKSIITKYNSLLNAIDGKYQTNMSMKKITSLVKMQLDDMSPWTVTSYSLGGYDSTDYTYTYNQLLYVMKPDEKSVKEAIALIDSVLKDEKLDNSYNDINGPSNKVTQAPVVPISPSNEATPKEEEEKSKEEEPPKDEEVDEKIDNNVDNNLDNNENKENEENDDNKENNIEPPKEEEEKNPNDNDPDKEEDPNLPQDNVVLEPIMP